MSHLYNDNINKLIVKHLSSDLLHPSYKLQKNKLAGHCYIASEVAYYLYAKEEGYVPYCLKYKNQTHWILVLKGLNSSPKESMEYLINSKYWTHKKALQIFFNYWAIDLTAKQFSPPLTVLDYLKGTKKGFLTKQPSKRAQILIDRVMKDII